jgi:hypothetical protein
MYSLKSEPMSNAMCEQTTAYLNLFQKKFKMSFI